MVSPRLISAERERQTEIERIASIHNPQDARTTTCHFQYAEWRERKVKDKWLLSLAACSPSAATVVLILSVYLLSLSVAAQFARLPWRRPTITDIPAVRITVPLLNSWLLYHYNVSWCWCCSLLHHLFMRFTIYGHESYWTVRCSPRCYYSFAQLKGTDEREPSVSFAVHDCDHINFSRDFLFWWVDVIWSGS